MLPADQVEALQRLVDEVQRVAAVGEHAVGRRREQHVGQRRGRRAGRDRGQQGALGPVPVPDRDPAAEPALQRVRVRRPRRAGRGPAAAAGRRSPPRPAGSRGTGRGGPPPRAAAPAGCRGRSGWSARRPSRRGCGRRTGRPARTIPAGGTPPASRPAVALATTSPRSWASPSSSRAGQCAGRVGAAEGGPDPDLAVAHPHGAGRDVVGPEVEGAATGEVEAGVVPVAGQDAVLDACPGRAGSPCAGSGCRAPRPGRGRGGPAPDGAGRGARADPRA